jgi:hypothetical protein
MSTLLEEVVQDRAAKALLAFLSGSQGDFRLMA